MKIVLIKLISGEELIGRVKDTTNLDISAAAKFGLEATAQAGDYYFNKATGFKVPDSVTLSMPRVIMPQMAANGQIAGVGMLPFMLGNPDADVTIDLKSRAIAVIEPISKLEEAYVAQTSPVKIASTMPAGGKAGAILGASK